MNSLFSHSPKAILVFRALSISVLINSCANSESTGSAPQDATSNYVSGTTSVEGTKECLADVDWGYPSVGDLVGAWKFSSDGTFNSSTTLFGGMSTWGTWQVVNPGEVQIEYTRTTEGYLPEPQVLKLTDCNRLYVGSTEYVKL